MVTCHELQNPPRILVHLAREGDFGMEFFSGVFEKRGFFRELWNFMWIPFFKNPLLCKNFFHNLNEYYMNYISVAVICFHLVCMQPSPSVAVINQHGSCVLSLIYCNSCVYVIRCEEKFSYSLCASSFLYKKCCILSSFTFEI